MLSLWTNESRLTSNLKLTSSTLAIVMSITLAPGVYAQDDDDTSDDVDQVSQADAGAVSEEKILVTGSRIRRDEFTSPSPIQVLDPELGVSQGRFDTGALVQGSTLAAGSSQLTSGISANSASPQGGEGVQTVSLRGLGANRTLVLLDGKRAGPAGVRGQVAAFDLNVIPFSALESVEILKDGASSIYGSDAVAGVVNLITRRDFDGLELDAFYSQPFDGAGEFGRFNALYGKTFDGGHFQVAVDYQKQRRITKGDREFLDCPEDFIFDEQTGARRDVVDPRGPGVHGFNYTGDDGYACANGTTWGHIWLYDYSYIYSPNGSNAITFDEQGNIDPTTQLLQFDYDGSLAALGLPQWAAPLDPFQIGLPAGWFPVSTNRENYAVTQNYHVGERNDTFVPETTNLTFYADGAFELTDSVEVYADVLFSQRTTKQTGSNQYFNFGGTFNAPGLGAFGIPSDPVVNPLITGDALISPTTFYDHDGQKTTVDYMRAIGGLRGELPDGGFFGGWQWDIYAQHSRSRGEYRDEIVSGVVVSDIGDFRSSSCAGQMIENFSGVMTECIDIDYNDPQLLAGVLTPQQRALLFGVDVGETEYDQTYVEGIVDGELFSLPAGDVGFAVGATWREDSIKDTPGENARNGFIFLQNEAGITEGSSTTTEVFGEVYVPVLSDVPFFESLDVVGSLRWTDVDTVDSAETTWKFGVDWAVTDWFTLRGSRGTSFRAPALFELFLNNESFIVRQSGVDPCIDWAATLAEGGISQRIADNCAADGIPDDFSGGGVEPTVTIGGGLGELEPETSEASVVGFVFEPSRFLPWEANLSLAVDYYEIDIEGTVDTLDANQIVFGCYDSEVFPDEPLCDLFVRGQTGAPFNIDQITATFININSLKNTGLDYTLQYTQNNIFAGWDLDFRTNWVNQITDDEELFDGNVQSVNGEAGDPEWVGEANIILSKNDWTAFWGINYVGETSDEGDFIAANGELCRVSTRVGDYCVDLNAEATVYHNASLSRDFEDWRFTLGVSNLFDTPPPRVTTSGFNGAEISTIGQMPFVSQYDVFGRRAFVNVTKRF